MFATFLPKLYLNILFYKKIQNTPSKMNVLYPLIFIFYTFFLWQGCSGFKPPVYKSTKQIESLKKTNQELWHEKAKLKINNINLNHNFVVIKDENKRLSNINNQLNDQIVRQKADINKLRQKIESLQLKSNQKKYQYEQLKPENTYQTALKETIKIICGDNNLNYATIIAKKLKSNGYNIKLINPSSNSRNTLKVNATTVYFNHRSKNTAKRLLPFLGHNAVSKPLNWNSKYNVVVVTSINSGK